MTNEQKRALMLAIQKAPDRDVIAIAKSAGIKIECQHPSEVVNPDLRYVVMDQPDHPRLWGAFFPSEAAACRAFLLEKEIAPVEQEKTPKDKIADMLKVASATDRKTYLVLKAICHAWVVAAGYERVSDLSGEEQIRLVGYLGAHGYPLTGEHG